MSSQQIRCGWHKNVVMCFFFFFNIHFPERQGGLALLAVLLCSITHKKIHLNYK